MKLFSSQHDFQYPWASVTAANWVKYPNEVSTHVVAVDVLRREVDHTTGMLITERLITCEQPIPQWLRCFVGGQNRSYVREVSTVDPSARTLTMRSCNLTMSNLLKVYETCVYKPSESDPDNQTTFYQSAEITAYATFKRICDKIEDWSVERFDQNAKKGKIGFESVLKLLDEKLDIGNKFIDEVSGKTVGVIHDVSDKTVDVINEVSDKTVDVLHEVSDKTVVAISDVSVKTVGVLGHLTQGLVSISSGIFGRG